jgi:membrane protein
MQSQWQFGGLTPLELTKRTGKQISEDDVSGRSAQLSYYFLLALFPLLFVLLSALGYFAGAGTELRNDLMQYLSRAMPGDASRLVSHTIQQVIAARGSSKIILGLLGALWAASGGMGAIVETLNIAYGVKETRPYWKKRGISVGLTVALSVLILCSLVLTVYGGKLAELVGSHAGLGSPFVIGWKVVQWPVILAAMTFGFALIYYFAPNVDSPEWHWVSPGAVVGVVLWLAISFGLRVYLQYFNSYNQTYGSLGAVIILMLWLYLTGTAILVGGELNSEIAKADMARMAHEEKLRAIQASLEEDLKRAA